MRAALVIKKDDEYYGFGTAVDLDFLGLDMTTPEEVAFRDYGEMLFLGELRAYKDVLRYQKVMKEIGEKNGCEIHRVFIDQFNSEALRNMEDWVIRLKPMRKLVGHRSCIVCDPEFWEDAATAIIGTVVPSQVKNYVQHMKDTYKPFELTFDSASHWCTMSDYFLYN